MSRPTRSRVVVVSCVAVGAALVVPLTAPASAATRSDPVTTARQAAPDDLQPFYDQELAWTTCEKTLECAWLTVPRDYAKPNKKGTFKIRVIRQDATGTPEQYQGTLMLNPGGPGGSGYNMIKANLISNEDLHKAYDFVSFDPRGVARSAPVECFTDKEQDRMTFSEDVPFNRADRQRVVKTFAAGRYCALNDPTYRFMDTASTARDIDVLRAALGDSQVNWFGFSYGTKLGQMYAQLFPDRVRRMVLDGVVPSDTTYLDEAKQHAKSEAKGIRAFLDWCRTNQNCALSKDPDTAMQQLLSIMKKLRKNPVLTTTKHGTGRVNDAMFRSVVGDAVLDQGHYTDFNADLDIILKDKSYGSILNEAISGRSPDGTYADHSNHLSAFFSIKCNDSPTDATLRLRKIARVAKRMKKINPLTGADVWSVVQCHDWPTQSSVPVAPFVNDKRLPTILLVGSSRDYRTPLKWAVKAAEQIKKSSLIRTDDLGHTSYHGINKCVINSVNDYLLNGKSPGKDVSCAGDPVAPVPVG